MAVMSRLSILLSCRELRAWGYGCGDTSWENNCKHDRAGLTSVAELPCRLLLRPCWVTCRGAWLSASRHP